MARHHEEGGGKGTRKGGSSNKRKGEEKRKKKGKDQKAVSQVSRVSRASPHKTREKGMRK